MDKINVLYKKNYNFIVNIFFPCILVLYPLVKINQGIDVADTTYSLANFQYFGSMDGTWMVATFLANALGSLLMHLPFGGTLMGMYFYTALIQSITALGIYNALRRRLPVRAPAPLIFIGELMALGLCWCPSTILYNYLTYLIMDAGVILLYKGIVENNRRYYVAAGVLLGMNVAVRMPNVVQAAFIVAVWYGSMLSGRKLTESVKDTLWCMLGYVAGFGAPFLAICVRYGTGAYPAMVQTMFAMTQKATDYKPSAMVTGMFGDYITGLYWLVFAGICMAGGWALFAVQHRWFAGRPNMTVLCQSVDVAVLDFPDGLDGKERQRCKVTIEFAESDVQQLQSRGMDLDKAMEYYADWLYRVIKVNLAQDWEAVAGQEQVMDIVRQKVSAYY